MKASNFFRSMSSISLLFIQTSYGQPIAFNSNTAPVHETSEPRLLSANTDALRAGVKTLESNDKVQLWIYNQEERKLTISLSSDTHELWTMNSHEAYISRILNLSSLEDGVYVIEINNGKRRISKKLLIHSKIKKEKNIQID